MFREDKLIFNDREYLIRIYVERRRSTYMSIGRKVNIRVPKFFSEKIREEHIEKMKNKFLEYLKKDFEKYSPVLLRKYQSGETLSIFQKDYLLTIMKEKRKTSLVRLKENEIIFKIQEDLKDQDEIISKLLNKVLSKDLLPSLEERVNHFNNLYFKQKIKSVSLRNNSSKFGSCSHDKKLVFSTPLLLAPIKIIDYVIIHELCHTIHLNHSKRFWNLVRKYFPDYKDCEKWLRNNKHKLVI